MKHIVLCILCIIFLCLTVLGSCSDRRPTTGRPCVVVSIEPLRFFTQSIAGDRMDVVSLVPEGISPEMYEPTPQQMMMLSDAKAFFKVGQLGFETTWLPKVSENVPDLPIVDTSEGLSSLDMRSSVFDPHTWTSPRLATSICQTICDALCAIDTAGTAYYRLRLDSLTRRIANVETQIHQLLKDQPYRTFVIAHPALTEFAADFGLKQLSIEKDGKEPGVQWMKTLVTQCRQDSVKTILVQPEFNPAMACTLARETGAAIVTVNPLSYDWENEMLHIAQAIKNGK